MPRPRQPFGPNLRRAMERAPVPLLRDFFAQLRLNEVSVIDFAPVDQDADSARFMEFVGNLDGDVLTALEEMCRRVIDLSEGKGSSSLDTIVERQMYNTDIEIYQAQPDALCRSIWLFTHFNQVFMDAQSFHIARRYRDHGKLYSAFETAAEVSVALAADDIDVEALARCIGEALDLKARTTVTAIDLPKTDNHPVSVMVAVRHGGALSSFLDHRDNGMRETRYYRPAEEAILVYTPSLRKLEVCAQGYVVRDKTSRAFAEHVLGQDLSSKPLTGRNFNLERFGASFQLPLPDFPDVEVTAAKVIEVETRLGNWRRRLLLQVTVDDDIEKFADTFMGAARAAAARFGYSRVGIAVKFTRRDDGDSATLKLWISSGNTSNVQNDRDPALRDLGIRLLEFWGLSEPQQLLGQDEVGAYFDNLLFLYNYSEDIVSGAVLSNAGMDCERLQSAQILEKKGRQEIVLIEADGETLEAELGTGPVPGTLSVDGPFGEAFGVRAAREHVEYRIHRNFLSEIVLEALKRELGAPIAVTSTDHIAEFGRVPIGNHTLPIYLVRGLETLKQPALLDLEFRRRHHAGPGLVLSAGDTDIKYLGPNVVIPLQRVITVIQDEIILDPDALEEAFRAGQLMVQAADAPQVIDHTTRCATLHVPGKPPFNLFGEKTILFFNRLVTATRGGQIDVPTGELMAGMGSKSPQQLFSKHEWTELRDVYLCNPRPKSWRLCMKQQLG